MSSVLQATCEAGVVTVDGKEITPTLVLSEGVQSSQGVLIIDGDKSYYVAKTSLDLIAMIESLVEIITQVATVATTLDGVTVSPGTATAAITQLNLLKTQFEATKDQLR